MLIALFAGAIVGGYTAGRWRNTRVTAPALLRCFAGGLLMGWGSLLIPGSNDGLMLVGMPLLLTLRVGRVPGDVRRDRRFHRRRCARWHAVRTRCMQQSPIRGCPSKLHQA